MLLKDKVVVMMKHPLIKLAYDFPMVKKYGIYLFE